tara:strand:- start:21197 stop:22435 length:1239 start_codon:yes stop_codon:yes gene_type:complete
MAELQTKQLDDFYINSGLDVNEMNHNLFKNYVERNLHKSIYLLEKEINNNLLILDVRRLKIYFNQVIEKLQNSSFLKIDNSTIDEYVKEYDLDKENILNINNKELIHYLTLTGDPFDPLNGANYESFFKAQKIKSVFYKYTAKHEILFFLDRVKSLRAKHMKEPEKKKVSYASKYGQILSDYNTLSVESNYFRYYQDVLLSHTLIVRQEVEENILKLDTIKIPLYLDKTIKEIERSGFQNESSTMLDKYIDKYNFDLELLPEVEDENLREILKTKDYYQELPYNEFSEIEFIQEQFYKYGLRTETIKLLDYLRGLQNQYQNKPVIEKESKIKTNQLTSNQIVLLLQEIGFFTHPKIEDASKEKQAELISLISGLNGKNIKTNMRKLDNKPNDVTPNYQKDIDKINKILDDLI